MKLNDKTKAVLFIIALLSSFFVPLVVACIRAGNADPIIITAIMFVGFGILFELKLRKKLKNT